MCELPLFDQGKSESRDEAEGGKVEDKDKEPNVSSRYLRREELTSRERTWCPFVLFLARLDSGFGFDLLPLLLDQCWKERVLLLCFASRMKRSFAEQRVTSALSHEVGSTHYPD
jgi:hypothetical protein